MSFGYTKACFVYRVTQKISDILWPILGSGWKCILNCVSWFISVILNLMHSAMRMLFEDIIWSYLEIIEHFTKS